MKTAETRKNLLEKRRLHISCVVPVYNEGGHIQAFLEALYGHLKQQSDYCSIIVVDDGSRDHTPSLIQPLLASIPIKLLQFSRNFGKEHAIAAGLEHATGDVTLIIDADFQHPIDLIPQFIERWLQGYDVIYGLRENRNDDAFIKRKLTPVFYKLLAALTSVPIPANAGDFRLLDRQVVRALNHCKERSRFMKGLYAWVGFKSIGIPFQVSPRKSGKSAWNLRRFGQLALTGIFSFSDIPLRIWTLIGLAISGIAFCYALFIVYETMTRGVDVPGYATIVVAIMFFGGIQLLSIGILGEYIARIFTEVKQRPSYIFSEIIESPLLSHADAADEKIPESATN